MNLFIIIVAGAILLAIHLLVLKYWFEHLEEVIRESRESGQNQKDIK